jgi:hypothetical protein
VKLVGVAKGVEVELMLFLGEEAAVRNEVTSWDFARPEINKQIIKEIESWN